MSDSPSASSSRNNEHKQPQRWEVVATAFGLAPAQIMAGRLQSEGIPARAWQESAGRATGLVVGLLGTGYVEVPEPFVEQALDILGSAVDPADIEYDDFDDDSDLADADGAAE